MAYNIKMFPNRFDGDIEAAFAAAEEARIKADKLSKTSSGTGTNRPTSRRNRTRISKTSMKEPETTTKEETNNDESQEAKKELSPEEIERRRKKNAKKRAKQKAKKAAQKQQAAEENADEEGT